MSQRRRRCCLGSRRTSHIHSLLQNILTESGIRFHNNGIHRICGVPGVVVGEGVTIRSIPPAVSVGCWPELLPGSILAVVILFCRFFFFSFSTDDVLPLLLPSCPNHYAISLTTAASSSAHDAPTSCSAAVFVLRSVVCLAVDLFPLPLILVPAFPCRASFEQLPPAMLAFAPVGGLFGRMGRRRRERLVGGVVVGGYCA